MITGVDHVQIAAPEGCEAEARQFYGALLMLEEVPKPELLAARGGVWFRAGDQQLHIGVETPFAPAAKAHPGLRVTPDGLNEVAARLAAAGVPPVWDNSIPGTRRFYVKDPSGNRPTEFSGATERRAAGRLTRSLRRWPAPRSRACSCEPGRC